MPILQPGQMIKDYRIVNQIGKGGMASVFKAYQANMGRYVAVKVLSFQLADNEEFLSRFKQEARLIAHLEHPNILPVYDYGEDHGVPFFVMRYLEAGTLKDRFRNVIPMLTLEEIDCIFVQLTEALGYAHENGVIHRDIKPSNIMLDRRGAVFLTDFGVAKAMPLSITTEEMEGDPRFAYAPRQDFTIALELTATGAITGTPDYMSPEQAQGLKLDQRSDIYSLGIVLYEMLTGKVPYEAETPMAVIMKQIAEPLPPPSQARPGLHPLLEAVVQKALAKKPAERYTSMADFRHAWREAYDIATSRNAPKGDEPQHSPKDPTWMDLSGLPPTHLKPAPWANKASAKPAPQPARQPAAASPASPAVERPPLLSAKTAGEYPAGEYTGVDYIDALAEAAAKGSSSSSPSPAPRQPAGILHGLEIDHVEMASAQVQVDNPLTTFRQNGTVKPGSPGSQGAADGTRSPQKAKTASRKYLITLWAGILALLLLGGTGWLLVTQYFNK
jgi:serine/threonine protein kinase